MFSFWLDTNQYIMIDIAMVFNSNVTIFLYTTINISYFVAHIRNQRLRDNERKFVTLLAEYLCEVFSLHIIEVKKCII